MTDSAMYTYDSLTLSKARDSFHVFPPSVRELREQVLKEAKGKVFLEMDNASETNTTRQASEKALFYYISTGNIAKVAEIMVQFEANIGQIDNMDYSRIGEMSENITKQAISTLISAVTLYTRAAVEGGLPEIIAYNLSDSYIHTALDLTNPHTVDSLSVSALYDFTYEVYAYKYKSCSHLVRTCCEYIGCHLHDTVTMAILSELTGKSPNYISDCFQKDLQVRPTVYIRKRKLEYAKHTLEVANISVSALATLLAFPSTSSFITYFKEEYGVTPLQYAQGKSQE